jgi:hypothetical protein
MVVSTVLFGVNPRVNVETKSTNIWREQPSPAADFFTP